MRILILLSLVLLTYSQSAEAKIKYLHKTLDASGQFEVEMHRFQTVDSNGQQSTWLAPSVSLGAYLLGNQYYNLKFGFQGLFSAYDQDKKEKVDYTQVSPQLSLEYRRISNWHPQLVFMGTRGSGEETMKKFEDRALKVEWKNLIPVSKEYAFTINFGVNRFTRYYFEKHDDIEYYHPPQEFKRQYGYVSAGIAAQVN